VSSTTGCKYFLVKNFVNYSSFFEWNQSTYDSYFNKFGSTEELVVPKLRELAYEQVELASVPFTTFVANKNRKGDLGSYSHVLRGYVRHWLRQVWDEYDRIKLQDVVSGVATDPHFDGNGDGVGLESPETETSALQPAS